MINEPSEKIFEKISILFGPEAVGKAHLSVAVLAVRRIPEPAVHNLASLYR
jgi:hypothetical protein